MSKEKYDIIFGEKEANKEKDFFNTKDIEIIPVILKVEENIMSVKHGNTFGDIISFFTGILEKKFRGLYNIIITSDFKESFYDKINSLDKPIQVCFLEDKILPLDSRKAMYELDEGIINLKHNLKKHMEKGYFFLIVPIFTPGRPGESLIRSLRHLNQILYVRWT